MGDLGSRHVALCAASTRRDVALALAASVELVCARGEALLHRLSAEAGIQRSVAVRVHESIPGPMTYGILRPVIMLPLDATAGAKRSCAAR